MPSPRNLIPFLTMVLSAAAPAPSADPPQMPSQLCIARSAVGYRLDPRSKGWIVVRFAEQKYILRAFTGADRQTLPDISSGIGPAYDFGLFEFATGNLAGSCSVHAPPFIKPKLVCGGWNGTLDIDPFSGRFERFSRGGYVPGGDGTVVVELGVCRPI